MTDTSLNDHLLLGAVELLVILVEAGLTAVGLRETLGDRKTLLAGHHTQVAVVAGIWADRVPGTSAPLLAVLMAQLTDAVDV